MIQFVVENPALFTLWQTSTDWSSTFWYLKAATIGLCCWFS